MRAGITIVDLAANASDRPTHKLLQPSSRTPIASSLIELGTCIERLHSVQARGEPGGLLTAPFRQNSLTRLLQPMLAGDCTCASLACCTVADSDMAHTLSTLRLGVLLRAVHTNVTSHSHTAFPPSPRLAEYEVSTESYRHSEGESHQLAGRFPYDSFRSFPSQRLRSAADWADAWDVDNPGEYSFGAGYGGEDGGSLGMALPNLVSTLATSPRTHQSARSPIMDAASFDRLDRMMWEDVDLAEASQDLLATRWQWPSPTHSPRGPTGGAAYDTLEERDDDSVRIQELRKHALVLQRQLGVGDGIDI